MSALKRRMSSSLPDLRGVESSQSWMSTEKLWIIWSPNMFQVRRQPVVNTFSRCRWCVYLLFFLICLLVAVLCCSRGWNRHHRGGCLSGGGGFQLSLNHEHWEHRPSRHPSEFPQFKHIPNVSYHSAQALNFPIFSFGNSVFQLFNFHQTPGGKWEGSTANEVKARAKTPKQLSQLLQHCTFLTAML